MFFFTQLQRFFKREIQASRSDIKRTDIRIPASNILRLHHARLLKSKIRINGANNIIESHGTISTSRLYIEGQNNSLYIADGCSIRNSSISISGTDCEIRIEKNTTTGEVMLVCMGRNNFIHIGAECMIADKVDIWASDTHPIFDTEKRLLNPSRPINIGNHVWLGRYVKILKGASIGDGAVVGMNSVVTKDVKPNSLNAGNPCRCLKENITWARDHIYPYE